ncbi:MAG TPA: HNH endonuclease family protein, partial [Hyphomicrobiaceae bacterium]|nr:HNH endonuclease family protein [Hyphomicrobiaceae bacterium]
LDLAEGKTPPDRVLAAISAGSGAGARPRITLRGADEEFFNAYVRTRRRDDAEDPVAQSMSARRIRDVYDHFYGTLAEHGAAERRRLLDFVLDRCHASMVTAHNIDRAHRMFMILNATGKPLERHDIVKAKLLGSMRADAVERLGKSWEEVQALLGEDFSELFSYLHAAHQRPGPHIIASIEELADRSGGAETFLTEVMEPAAQILKAIRSAQHGGSPHSPAIAHALAYLNRLPHSDWIPPALLWWLRHGEDAAGLAWFLGALDRLTHGLMMMGWAGGKRRTRYRALLAAIRAGRDLRAPDSPLQLSPEEKGSIHFRLRDLHGRKGGPTAKLVLLRINDQMAGAAQSLALDKDTLTVEHVLPRKPGAQWRAAFPDPAERERCIGSLGNCLILSRAQNDRAANHDFTHKHRVYFQTADAPPMALNDWLRDKVEWTSEVIRQRELNLLQALDALWDLGAAAGGPEGRPARTRADRRKRALAANAPAGA